MRQLLNTEGFADTIKPVEEQSIIDYGRLNEYYGELDLSGDGRRHQHIPYTKERAEKLKNAVGFMIVRDPRDVIVSHAHYAERVKDKTGIDYKSTSDGLRLSNLTLRERIDVLNIIMRHRLCAYAGWAFQENVHVFKYSEFIINQEKQIKRMMAILDGHGLLDATYDEMVERARPKPSGAFRRGQVGDYKHTFTDEQNAEAKRRFGDFIEAWS
jgi:hypothetical protein